MRYLLWKLRDTFYLGLRVTYLPMRSGIRAFRRMEF